MEHQTVRLPGPVVVFTDLAGAHLAYRLAVIGMERRLPVPHGAQFLSGVIRPFLQPVKLFPVCPWEVRRIELHSQIQSVRTQFTRSGWSISRLA
jgi:hypothetical protein